MSKLKKTLAAVGIGLGIGIVVTAGIFILKLSVHGKMPPGTSISGIDVSYKTPQETKEILEESKKKYLKTPLKLTLRNTTMELTPETLGIDILVNETIQIISETDAGKISILDWLSFTSKEPTTINILTRMHQRTILWFILSVDWHTQFLLFFPK